MYVNYSCFLRLKRSLSSGPSRWGEGELATPGPGVSEGSRDRSRVRQHAGGPVTNRSFPGLQTGTQRARLSLRKQEVPLLQRDCGPGESWE